MCLEIWVEAPATGRASLEAAAASTAETGLRVTVEHSPPWPWARHRQVRAFISKDASCACSMLSDDADWNAPSWAMLPEVLEPLARVVAVLGERGPEQMTLQALWGGDRAEQVVHLSATELASLARSSQLGTRTKYVIERASGPTTG